MTSLDFRNTNTLWCSVLVETLSRLGLRQAVISPGSRSAPLTFAFARHRGIESIPVLDERSAGFLALGLAKQEQRPVALVCTSGTAAANFLPAVVEAHESGGPLLVLTADRPPELRGCHSGQSINQQGLYGGFTAFFRDLPVPAARLDRLRGLVATLRQAWLATARPMRGPVHLNCPFRDPLPPLRQDLPAAVTSAAVARILAKVKPARPTLPAPAHDAAAWWRKAAGDTGVIVVGPNDPVSLRDFVAQVGRLARSTGWPVLADALSPVRHQAGRVGPVVAHYDGILRSPARANELLPRRVICVGGWPTSKVLREWLKRANPETLLLTDRTDDLDGLRLRTTHVRGDFAAWCAGFPGRSKPADHTRRWLEEDRRVARTLAAALENPKALVEPALVPLLARHLPAGTVLFVASSMPVRDLEYFWPADNGLRRVQFNRGANGIDGTLSTALGVAHRAGVPAVLLTGDLALLHDTNGFLSAPRFEGSLTVLLVNNHGGGIFEHLPVAQFDPPFEEFFATPQRADFAKLAAAYGVEHVRVRDAQHLARLVAKLPARGVRLLEVRTDRKRDAAFRKQLFAGLAR